MAESKERLVYLLERTDKPYDGTDVYVGSTSRSLRQRLWEHRYDATRLDNKLYKRMREVGADKWKVTLLLLRTCDKKTIRELEREKCSELNADLNTNEPITTPEEKIQYKADYREKNKEAILKNQADYREKNKEAILKYAADYYEKNKEKVNKKIADCRKKNREEKKYHCAICEVACCSNWGLQKHLHTIKHGYAYLNSLD